MNESIIVGAVLATACALGGVYLLVLAWRAAQRQAANIRELENFRDRYRSHLLEVYRWFAGDECVLMVIDWMDFRLTGGEFRPTDDCRMKVASQGLLEVRQAVRDSQFNDRCRSAAITNCATDDAQRQVPDEIVLDARVMRALRNAWVEGIDFDEFMALGVSQLRAGRWINVVLERRELLEDGKVAGLTDHRLLGITNNVGERLWPLDDEIYAVTDENDVGQPSPVQVTYELVKPTVDEKLDEILKLLSQFCSKDAVNITMTGATPIDQAEAIATHIHAGEGIRVPRETLVPLSRPIPSGWAVVGKSDEPGDMPRYLGPLEGWMDDPRRAVLFGNKEAAISAAATLNMVCPRDVSVVWMVYSHHLGNYVEQAQ